MGESYPFLVVFKRRKPNIIPGIPLNVLQGTVAKIIGALLVLHLLVYVSDNGG